MPSCGMRLVRKIFMMWPADCITLDESEWRPAGTEDSDTRWDGQSTSQLKPHRYFRGSPPRKSVRKGKKNSQQTSAVRSVTAHAWAAVSLFSVNFINNSNVIISIFFILLNATREFLRNSTVSDSVMYLRVTSNFRTINVKQNRALDVIFIYIFIHFYCFKIKRRNQILPWVKWQENHITCRYSTKSKYWFGRMIFSSVLLAVTLLHDAVLQQLIGLLLQVISFVVLWEFAKEILT